VKPVDVVCGLVIGRRGLAGLVLMGKRPEGKPLPSLWEYPGGKVEAGEAHDTALKREFYEELDATVRVGPLISVAQFRLDETLRLFLYQADLVSGSKLARRVHTEIAWHTPQIAIKSLSMVPSSYLFYADVVTHLSRKDP